MGSGGWRWLEVAGGLSLHQTSNTLAVNDSFQQKRMNDSRFLMFTL